MSRERGHGELSGACVLSARATSNEGMGLLARVLAPLLFVTTLPSVAHADGGGCFLPITPPAIRRVNDLTVTSPARTESPPPGLRLRTNVRPQDHMWIGPDV